MSGCKETKYQKNVNLLSTMEEIKEIGIYSLKK